MNACAAIELPSEKLHYAENNVHQCWSCKRRCGAYEVTGVIRRGSELIHIPVLLPECEVAQRYMTYVQRCPCHKYMKEEDDER